MAPRPRENSQQKRETQCTDLYAALRDGARHCNRYSAACVQRASTRIMASGASEPIKGRPQRASEPNTKPGGMRVVCALRFFLRTKRIFKEILWATRARSLCFINQLWNESSEEIPTHKSCHNYFTSFKLRGVWLCSRAVESSPVANRNLGLGHWHLVWCSFLK